MDEKKVIGNVNILDLRNATEQSVAEIKTIGNVNLAIVKRATVPLLTRLAIGNINATVEVPDNINVSNSVGQIVINRNYISGLDTPIFLVAIGQIIFEVDVQAQDIERGIDGFALIGQVILPESIAGVVQAKCKQMIGEKVVYPAYSKIHQGSLVLDSAYLMTLPNLCELVVIGNIEVPSVVESELLEKKLKKLWLSGKLLCHEENLEMLQNKIEGNIKKVNVIPKGYEYIDVPLNLDQFTLESLPSKKLYCSEIVRIFPDIAPDKLNESIESLVCKELLIAPASVRNILAQKCNLLKTKSIFYEGDLWIINEEQKFSTLHFQSIKGKITLINHGDISIDPEVSQELLEEKLVKIHNFGQINCNPEQSAVIRHHLGINEGNIADTPHVEEDTSSGFGNVNVLVL
jgi:hypothetical protein